MLGIANSWTVFYAAAPVFLCLLSPAPALLAQDTTPPVLSVPFHTLEEMSEFLPYGQQIPGKPYKNVTYEIGFRSDRGSYPPEKYPLKAVCAGVVTAVWRQPQTKDYEIWTQPTVNSIYAVMYDHVVKPKVRKGDQFQAGALLGYLGNELQINRTDPTTHKVVGVCPRDLGTPSFNRVFDDLLAISGFKDSAVCLAIDVIP